MRHLCRVTWLFSDQSDTSRYYKSRVRHKTFCSGFKILVLRVFWFWGLGSSILKKTTPKVKDILYIFNALCISKWADYTLSLVYPYHSSILFLVDDSVSVEPVQARPVARFAGLPHTAHRHSIASVRKTFTRYVPYLYNYLSLLTCEWT